MYSYMIAIILHISSERDFSIETYKSSEHKIKNINNLIGDEYGIAVFDYKNEIWYYINRYSRSVSELGKAETLIFTNELCKIRRRQLIKSLEIPGLLNNVQGIISEYMI